MKATTRHLMQSLKFTARGVVASGITRAERAAKLRALRRIKGGRESLRDTHLCDMPRVWNPQSTTGADGKERY